MYHELPDNPCYLNSVAFSVVTSSWRLCSLNCASDRPFTLSLFLSSRLFIVLDVYVLSLLIKSSEEGDFYF